MLTTTRASASCLLEFCAERGLFLAGGGVRVPTMGTRWERGPQNTEELLFHWGVSALNGASQKKQAHRVSNNPCHLDTATLNTWSEARPRRFTTQVLGAVQVLSRPLAERKYKENNIFSNSARRWVVKEGDIQRRPSRTKVRLLPTNKIFSFLVHNIKGEVMKYPCMHLPRVIRNCSEIDYSC